MKQIGFLAVFLLVLATSCRNKTSVSEQSNALFYAVSSVVDGDTFWLDDGSEKGLKVRLIGVNAPESRATGRKVKEDFGMEAKHFLTGLLHKKRVRLEYDVDKTDPYGRALAYVYLEDGTFLNAYLVEQGYAHVATYPPNVRYVEVFKKLEQTARKKKRGLWKAR
ncbi:MAG TPA: thermonuclease family protein [Bacteroidales bacterium]|jgi:micrococcal nuclease|nr:thermonuclease family protein [Bacteroidales bacterium]